MTIEKKVPKNLDELLEIIRKAKSEGAEVEFQNAETGETGADALMDSLRDTLPPGLGDMIAGKIETALAGSVRPATAEMVHALLEVVAVHQSPPKFKVGQFVRFRPYVTYVKSGRNLHVITDVLDEPIVVPMDQDSSGYSSAYRRLNVIVAVYVGKHTICKYYADSRELEPYPDIEKLMGKHS